MLTSLALQSTAAEVIVVNDGSNDHTQDVLEGAPLPIRPVQNAVSMGRSAASNLGASLATGDVLLFLDGDTLAAPDLVAKHVDLHCRLPGRIVRGATMHLRCTRLFLNPETGTPRTGEEVKVGRMSPGERSSSLVTKEQVRDAFHQIDNRAQPGIYPGYGPRRLFELEIEALKLHPECTALWAAASGNNMSVSREAFLKSGGFHPDITISEHRELALKLCKQGFRMDFTEARTYHLTHRNGWRDPLQDTSWEKIFYNNHPNPEVALLPFFWASLSEAPAIPKYAFIRSLPELEEIASRYRDLPPGLETIRTAHLRLTQQQVAE